MEFFEKFKGLDDEISHEFAVGLQPQGEDSATIMRGLFIQ